MAEILTSDPNQQVLLSLKISIFLFGCARSSLLHGLSSSVASGGRSPGAVGRLLVVVVLLVMERRLSSCGARS